MNTEMMVMLTPKERIERYNRLQENIDGMERTRGSSPLALADAKKEAAELLKLIKKDVKSN